MYKIGELIIYGKDGVCKVEDIGTPNITGINKEKVYYTLKPIYQDGKIFTPVDTSVFMRAIITHDELQQLIEFIPSIEETQCNEKNSRVLQDYYKEFLKTHECSDLLTIMKSAYDKKTDAINNGKKFGQIDEKFMKIAEDLIHDEFAVVLGIPRNEVATYIEEKVKAFENLESSK